jgi:hypothetical protein
MYQQLSATLTMVRIAKINIKLKGLFDSGGSNGLYVERKLHQQNQQQAERT